MNKPLSLNSRFAWYAIRPLMVAIFVGLALALVLIVLGFIVGPKFPAVVSIVAFPVEWFVVHAVPSSFRPLRLLFESNGLDGVLLFNLLCATIFWWLVFSLIIALWYGYRAESTPNETMNPKVIFWFLFVVLGLMLPLYYFAYYVKGIIPLALIVQTAISTLGIGWLLATLSIVNFLIYGFILLLVTRGLTRFLILLPNSWAWATLASILLILSVIAALPIYALGEVSIAPEEIRTQNVYKLYVDWFKTF